MQTDNRGKRERGETSSLLSEDVKSTNFIVRYVKNMKYRRNDENARSDDTHEGDVKKRFVADDSSNRNSAPVQFKGRRPSQMGNTTGRERADNCD